MLEQITQSMSQDIWGWTVGVGIGITTTVVIISILIEAVSIIFLFTPTEKDDLWIAKIEKQWLEIKPFLEWFHVKTPVLLVLNKVLDRVRKIKETIEKAKEKDKE